LQKILSWLKSFQNWITDPFLSISRKQLEKSVKHQILFLLVFVGFIIFLFGTLFAILGLRHDSGNPYWFAIISLLGPDGLFELEGESFSIRTLSFILTIFGLVIFNGILIAIVVSNLQRYFEEIRRGSGPVRCKDHLVVFGWSSSIPTLLKEIEIYSLTESAKQKVVVVTEQVREEAAFLGKQFKKIEYFYRTGSALIPKDLKRFRIKEAKSILIFYDNPKFNSAGDSDEYDAKVIKSYLSIQTYLEGTEKNILTNFSNIANAKYLEKYKMEKSVFFDSYFYSAKFICMLLKDRSHYEIFHELLSFTQNDFHFFKKKEWEGKTFREIYLSLSKGILIGFFRSGKIFLLPSHDDVYSEKDELIFLSMDSKSITFQNETKEEIFKTTFHSDFKMIHESRIKNITILGINPRLPYILEEFHKEKCKVYLLGHMDEKTIFSELQKKIPKECLENLNYQKLDSDAEEILQTKLFWKEQQKLIILSDENSITYVPSNHTIDEKTLLYILKLEQIKEKLKLKDEMELVCEVKDPNSELVVQKILGKEGRYVIGTSIAAKIMNMGLIHKGYLKLFYELLQKGNVDMGISLYSDVSSEPCAFGELLTFSYLHRNMIPLGVIPKSGNPILNPPRDFLIQTEDKVIFLYMSEIHLL
jgi:hypothetical protein